MKTIADKSWWKDAKFGMFIHWGIYSLLERGEWVMYVERIPVKEYEKLAGKFNPTKFDADAWVRLAKSTGMKYIIITAKHHDGFSMFRTSVDAYNVVDGTPYGKDVMLDLAKACERHGLRLCFYYSHVREWRHPHAQSLEMKSPDTFGNYGNFWDYPDETRKNLQKYIDEFDKPQLRELLTQYGQIGIIWFDTPSLIRPDQAQELIDLVRELQPNCLVNSRVGQFVTSDYVSLGDNEVPEFGTGEDWETPMTICDAWGYNSRPDNQYRDVDEILHQLVDIVSLGGNYLLNVGPDPTGVIPDEAQERLRAVGEWMGRNGKSIHGTEASPFAVRPSWGRITRKGNSLFLHVYDWNGRISLTGIKSRVVSVTLIADEGRALEWDQTPCVSLGYDRLTIELPGAPPDESVSVLEVRLEQMVLETGIIPADSGVIQLPACRGTLHSSSESGAGARVNITGVVRRWYSPNDWFSWDFACETAGEYDASIITSTDFRAVWDFGHEVVIEHDGQSCRAKLQDSGVATGRFQKRRYGVGTIRIAAAGRTSLSIRALELASRNGEGLTMTSIILEPKARTR